MRGLRPYRGDLWGHLALRRSGVRVEIVAREAEAVPVREVRDDSCQWGRGVRLTGGLHDSVGEGEKGRTVSAFSWRATTVGPD
jgi:hypothetical protein